MLKSQNQKETLDSLSQCDDNNFSQYMSWQKMITLQEKQRKNKENCIEERWRQKERTAHITVEAKTLKVIFDSEYIIFQ